MLRTDRTPNLVFGPEPGACGNSATLHFYPFMISPNVKRCLWCGEHVYVPDPPTNAAIRMRMLE